jgi:Ni/Fe-hydrogenase subunit HybB-like protein
MTEEVVTKVVPAVVKIAVVVKIVLVAVLVKIVVVAAVVIVPVDQAEDNNNKSSRDRHRLDIKA